MISEILLLVIILVSSVYHLDAFLTEPLGPHHSFSKGSYVPHAPRRAPPNAKTNGRGSLDSSRPPTFLGKGLNGEGAASSSEESDKLSSVESPKALTHKDILWKLRVPPDVSRFKRIWLRVAANLIRLDCKLKRQEPPFVLCPKGGQAVLEAYVRDTNKKGKRRWRKVGRFGFTTERGPSHPPPIQESLQDLYGLGGAQGLLAGIAAIKYMYVEPEFRELEVGSLALQVLSLIHAVQGVDFTILVADDNGSGKLVKWYERHGFQVTPKLQDLMGSPNGVHGVAMMAPTNQVLPDGCFVQWW